MSQANVEVVKRLFKSYRRGDLRRRQRVLPRTSSTKYAVIAF
jgi:hypothetical protein